MKYKENDINNYTGVEKRCYYLNNEEDIHKILEAITERALIVGHYLLDSWSTEMVNLNLKENKIFFYEEIQEGLYECVLALEFDETVEKFFLKEDVIVQGYREDEEGNTESADIIGIEVSAYDEYNNLIDFVKFEHEHFLSV